MTLHNELHSLFSLGLLSKRSLYCTGESASPFYLQKKTLVATVWSIKLLKGPPPPFIPLPERNIKLSVFPSDMRTEISSLSIKMSRYFISVPVGPEALTLFNVALLYSSLMCAPSLPPSLPVYFISARGPLLTGWGVCCRPCTSVGLTGARAPSEVIDFNQWLERLELNGAVDFKRWSAALFVVWGENAAGGGILLLKGSQINIQTELYREREISIFWFGVLLNVAGYITGVKWPK